MECGIFFLIGQNRSSNQVQIQNFGTRRRMRVKVLIFKKFQGAQILLFFCENWHEASFNIKEQTQKSIEILDLKRQF